MFFIYGFKYELEDDLWSGELQCPVCGASTKHIFKLEKKYPTLFFIKIPLCIKVVKRHLVCTRCGENRVVKKAEYEAIKQSNADVLEN